jgi:hypothetical protein
MGWLLAFLFLVLAGLLGFLLYGAMNERAALMKRIAELEPKADGHDQALVERQKMAAAYNAMRKRFHGVLDADAEKAKVVAQTKQIAERFNAQLAEAKKKWEAEVALRQSRLAARAAAAEAEYAAFRQRCEDEQAAHYARLATRTTEVEAQAEAFRQKHEEEQTAHYARLAARTAEVEAEIAELKKKHMDEVRTMEAEIGPLRAEHKALSDEAALVDMGFYRPRHNFVTSERYKKAIDENYDKQKEMLTGKKAARCDREWVLDGSAAKGRKHVEKTLSLMLRAFNGECDSAIAKVKATNFQTMENRIRKSFEAVNKLGQMQECYMSEEYRDLRLQELQLEYEHAQKVQAEREEQRAIKEEMRQQAIAEKEAERAQQEAEREQRQYQAALEKARAEMARVDAEKEVDAQVQQEKHSAMESRIAELEQMMAEANAKQERAMSLAQQTRSGHVYVISNIGSFGTHVYKIGMTRRLDPMDRIWELSDASVPFDFDVHAIIYTDDAPGLESELHQRFAERRINVVNERKEFFHVTIEEIAEVVRERCGDIELTLAAEAAEFLQSEAYRRENGKPLADQRRFAVSYGEPANA